MKSRIAVVAIAHPTEPNLFLHGLRRDNGKWALPGGHVNPGETLIEGARREAQEEAGLDLKELEACRNGSFGDNEVHLFSHKCPANIDLNVTNDPDKEFVTFKWLDPSFHRNMHVPGHNNILIHYLKDSKKDSQRTLIDTEDEFEKSEKMQIHSKMTIEPFLEHDKFDPRKHDFIVRTHHIDGTKSFAAFTHKGNNIMPFNMEVHSQHRRKGHGSNMLRHAQLASRKKVMQSPDMTEDAKKLSANFLGKNELSGNSSEFTIEIDIPFEDDLLKSYHSPTKVGDVHPENGNVGVMHPTEKRIYWHAPPDRVASHDAFIKQNSASFLNTIQSPKHKKAMAHVINNVMKDPNRHFIPNEENGVPRLRARHIKSLIHGGKDVILDTSDPSALRIKRTPHSSYSLNKPITFKVKLGEQSGITKSERNDRSGNSRPSEERLLRTTRDLQRRGYSASSGESGTSISKRDRSRINSRLAKSLSEDYKHKAANNAILLYPVSVNGKTSLGNNIPMHMTIKDFGDKAKLTDKDAHQIHTTIGEHAFHNPVNTDKMRFTPYRFRNVKGELQHVLLVSDLPDHVTSLFSKTGHYGPKVENYLHHIRIDDEMYKQLKKKGSVLTSKDVDVKFHPSEYREGSKVVKVYKP